MSADGLDDFRGGGLDGLVAHEQARWRVTIALLQKRAAWFLESAI